MAQLAPLVLGLVVFLVSHALPRWFGIREALVARFGKVPYQAVHGVLSLLGLGLIIYGYGHYRASGYIPLWEVPRFFNHIAILLLWPAMILLFAAFLPGAIKAKVKHPMLAGVKLWALVHLVLNGDLGSVLLFGAFLFLAVITRIRLSRLGEAEVLPGAGQATSMRNDILAVVLGSALTGALVMGLHRILIGVSIL